MNLGSVPDLELVNRKYLPNACQLYLLFSYLFGLGF